MNDTATEMAEDIYFDGKIKSVTPIEPRFQDMGEDAFELFFEVENNATHDTIETFLEFSSRYGVGNFADKTSLESSLERIKDLGYKHGNDLSKLQAMVGLPCRIRGKLNKAGTAYNYYFAVNNKIAINAKDLAKRTKEIMSALIAMQPSGETGATGADPFEDDSGLDENPF